MSGWDTLWNKFELNYIFSKCCQAHLGPRWQRSLCRTCSHTGRPGRSRSTCGRWSSEPPCSCWTPWTWRRRSPMEQSYNFSINESPPLLYSSSGCLLFMRTSQLLIWLHEKQTLRKNFWHFLSRNQLQTSNKIAKIQRGFEIWGRMHQFLQIWTEIQ